MVPAAILAMKLFDILPTLKDADSYALLLLLQG
jgi:hypothetical protein